MEVNQYLSMFIDESKEHLQAMNENLLSLESNPEDLSIVQTIFRSAHTLKGMSATMGFEDLASLTHETENVLDMVRNDQLKMNEHIFDVMFKSLDHLEKMVEDIIQGGTGKADVTEVVGLLKAIVKGDVPQDNQQTAASDSGPILDEFQLSILKQSAEAGHSIYRISVSIREDCMLKAVRAYMVFEALEQNGEVVISSPPAEDIEQDKFGRQFSLYYISQLDVSSLQSTIENISEIETVTVEQLQVQALDEIASAQKQAAAAAVAEAPKLETKKADGEAGSKQAAPKAAGQIARTIRVDIERLDQLMNLFSEMLIDRVRLESLADEIRRSDLTETVEHMTRISSELQNLVLKLRMVPVDTVFNRFPRMIRDIAKTLGKKIDLVISGADTELDRTVVDEIGDPLVHLLRNSVDHGVEPIEDRVKVGKSEIGTVHLRAYHSGNHVFIEIEDDGRGIIREKVLKTALKNGVVTEEQAGKMSDNEVFQLLFASGFSTADKITDISGRGVGLDVVKSKIQSLGGHVEVDSVPNKGSKFTIQLPLTLSIITAMLIRLGQEKYAIPLSSIVETALVSRQQLKYVHGQAMLDYRNGVIPVISLADVLDCPPESSESAEMNLVIVKKAEKHAALIVSEFIGQQEIVLKSLGNYLNQTFAVSGATILGDGQVALIIDPTTLIK
ncbi:chemotaxis protein CheW [Marinicrinis lubricantis]|uniref:Chemotaxis protein CheA n=1 Tax=Marinicrinis lubricantis TaxID=2086470 RepID=A0ABW1IMH9_9BACL